MEENDTKIRDLEVKATEQKGNLDPKCIYTFLQF
jgi:hypothetical protein